MSASLDPSFEALVLSSSLCLQDQNTFSSWAAQIHERLNAQHALPRHEELLDSIPAVSDAGTLPLASLALLLEQYPAQIPSFDIIRCYTKLWFGLPESVKSGRDERAARAAHETTDQICRHIGTLPSLFSANNPSPAMIDPTSQATLTHSRLSEFINTFSLPIKSSDAPSKPVVVLALPNGFLLGLAVLAVSSYYTTAPINIAGGPAQFRSDVELAGPQCILVLEADVVKLGLDEPWVAAAGIQIILASPRDDLTFESRPLQPPGDKTSFQPAVANAATDLSLILFTSGTSGTKKVVPTTHFGLLVGVQCVIDSWGLTPAESCLNMMPLNHVGGIVRNLFAPVLSGGSTILCPAFDPNLFWDILERGAGTWYYASPSMHMSILAEAELRGDSVRQCRLRLICNAAGGLLPALAARLQDTFGCTVLPSYGMTECMPISTPPLSYMLDRVGTSGIGCGPEIAILDEQDNCLPAGSVGRISVRGGPVFPGYLKSGRIDRSAFNADGWFDTGDLGNLDADGYLYLTGRGKEVINRGGEIISPFEVEEAITIASQARDSVLFGRVRQVLAFSAPHEVLQEVVGVALVTPPNQPRPDVRDLQTALKASLHSPKWPVVVVYMDALPTSNNKLVRIRLSDRMDMIPINNAMRLHERHFEAVCPPVNSLLTTKIKNHHCALDLEQVLVECRKYLEDGIEAHVDVSHHDGTPVVFLAPLEALDHNSSEHDMAEQLQLQLRRSLDGLLLPSAVTLLPTPFPRTSSGLIDTHELENVLKAIKHAHATPAGSETEMKIRKAFAEVLNFDVDEISADSDFFDMGGESMSAGILLSLLRRDLGVRMPVDKLFTSSKVSQVRELVDNILRESSRQSSQSMKPMPGCEETCSSTNPLVLIIHALPIVLIYPLKLGFQWTALMYSLSTLASVWMENNVASRFVALVASMAISRIATQIVAPIVAIAFKWIVIGRYKAGMYPMWGSYHTRWWIVDKVLTIGGKGLFRHLDITRRWYYKLLGAKIGKRVTIEKGTILAEYDLLDIGDDVHLDQCLCRPFAVERNTSMYLGQITIGARSSVGLKAHVAAGSTLPEDCFIGANSSSYEMDDDDSTDRRRATKSNFWLQVFLILPIQLIITFISSLPWMGGLWGIVMTEPAASVDSVRTVITWWATAHRIGYHYLAQSLNIAARPFVWFACVLFIKKMLNIIVGTAKPRAAEEQTQGDRLRSLLMTALVPAGSLKSLTKLFGSHYEVTSMAVRAMGGKVGKRVYWPGTGPSIQDFDLVSVGDDVVFGSRSHIITSDATGSDVVRIGNGAMIADRVVLSPGARVGSRSVLGSGAFIKRNQNCAPESVWVGNRNGGAVCLSTTKSAEGFERDDEKSAAPSYRGSTKGNSLFEMPPSYPSSSKYTTAANSKVDIYTTNEKGIDTATNTLASSGNSLSDEPSSSSPFGRAFYEGQAPYFVFGQFTIFAYSILVTVFVQLYWNIGTIATVILSQIMNRTHQLDIRWYRPLKVYAVDVAILSLLCIALSFLSLAIVIAAKWTLLGRRRTGAYDWDKSSYCQRWQLFLTIEAFRRRCFGGMGVLGMLTGTHYSVIYFRLLGAKIGKDCALFAGGRPSLVFTEPDLLTLGDRVSTDDASLVGHINSRGKFSLNELKVGDRSCLRSGSRLLSGASMGKDCVLLEHTLIMAGDEADDGCAYQGWPADVYRGDRLRIVSKRQEE